MVEFLRSWVLNIAVLSVIIAILEIMIPSGKTSKFVKLVTGFILLIALINPVLKLFKNGIDLNKIQLASSNLVDKYEIQHDSSILKESQMKQISSVYKQRLSEDIMRNLSSINDISITKVDVDINENYYDVDYGNINSIYIGIGKSHEKEKSRSIENVKKVEIKVSGGKNKLEPSEESNTDTEKVDNDTAEKIKNKVADFLGVDKDIITVGYDN